MELNQEQTSLGLRHRLLGLLGIEPTNDIHEPYRFLEDVRLDGKAVVIAKWPTTRYHIYWPHWIRRPLTLVYNHVSALAQTLRGLVEGRVVIVREYCNFGVALAAPLLWLWRHRIILNINDNFAPQIGALSRGSHEILRRLGFRFMLLDGQHVKCELERRMGQMKLLTPYFSVPDKRVGRRAADSEGDLFRVGFVGYFRPDKGGVTALADAIRKLQAVHGVEVALGYWNRGQAEQLPDDVRAKLVMRETVRYTDYLGFLKSCHAIVVLATPAYALRHSGVLVDSISCGTPVLCPDYSLLAFQALQPVPVGATYRTLEELPERVAEVKARHAELTANFDEYFRARAARCVSEQIAREWAAAARD